MAYRSTMIRTTATGMFGLPELFNHQGRRRGHKPPARDFFIALYYDLPVFNQCERGAKKIKRQDF